MESNIILDGFKQSVETHGLIYSEIICDADSNLYKKILDNNVYKEENVVPQRILCTNLTANSKIT